MPYWPIRYTGSLKQTQWADSNPGPFGIAFVMGVTCSSDRLARRVQRDDRISSWETIGRGTQSIRLASNCCQKVYAESSRYLTRFMPPSSLTRRKVLQVAAGSFGPLFGGCSTIGSQPTPTESTSPTKTNSPPISSPRFSFVATIIQQPSTSSPPQFRASLTNEGSNTVTVEYGADLLWSVDAEYPEILKLIPAKHLTENPKTTPNDQCWQHQDPVPIPAMATVHPFSPNEQLSQTFAVYNREDECYPRGEYSVRDEIEIEGVEGHVELGVIITINDSGEFAIEATPSEIAG